VLWRAALSTIARDGIDLIAGPLSERLRECAFQFADTSRPGARRRCAHNRCGNRHHVREYRTRRHAALRS
jgi:predicted RNA-binding Zn ribbon-like protein